MTTQVVGSETVTPKREILRVEDLHSSFFTKEGEVKAVSGVNFSLKEDSILGDRGRERLWEVGHGALDAAPSAPSRAYHTRFGDIQRS